MIIITLLRAKIIILSKVMLIISRPLGGSQLAIIQKILDIFLGYICYKYDHRNLYTRKVLPGCDSIIMRYNRTDRLIFLQDWNRRVRSCKLPFLCKTTKAVGARFPFSTRG